MAFSFFKKNKEGRRFFCSVIILLPFLVFAQENTTSIGILLFEANGVSDAQAQKISRQVETSLYKINRFNIVTRQLLDVLEQERETQKANIDKEVIEQGKAIGADYIVRGVVSKYKKDTERAKDKNGYPINKVFTKTMVSYTIKIIEVETGVIKATDSYSGSLNGIDHHVRNFIRKEFNYGFRILEVMAKKGDKKAKHVLLDGGYKEGLVSGLYLEVFELTEENFEGHILKREAKVGDLMLKKLDTGGHFSLCKITKGKKSIIDKMKNGALLVCKIPEHLRLFGMKFEYKY